MKKYNIFSFFILILFFSCSHEVNINPHDSNEGSNQENNNQQNAEYGHKSIENELKFFRNENWYDETWYCFSAKSEVEYTIKIKDCNNSDYTANIAFSVFSSTDPTPENFDKSEKTVYFDSSIMPEKKEYLLTVNNNTQIFIHIFPYEKTSESIGTYCLETIDNNGQSAYLKYYKHGNYYQLRVSAETDLSVGNTYDYCPFVLEKYDDTYSAYENTIIEDTGLLYIQTLYALDNISTYKRYYLLRSGEVKVQVKINDFNELGNEIWTTYSDTFYIKPESENNNPLKIEISDEVDCSVGLNVPVKVKLYDNQITGKVSFNSDGVPMNGVSLNLYNNETNNNNPRASLSSTDGKANTIYLNCFETGYIYLLATVNDNNIWRRACTIIDIKSDSLYSITSEGIERPCESKKFYLKHEGEDISDSATWSCYSSTIDFDASTHIATFYGANENYTVRAIYNGVTFEYNGKTNDKDVYDINLDSDLSFEKFSFSDTYESYTINITGSYNAEKIRKLDTGLSTMQKPFTVNMTEISNLTVLEGTSNGGLFSTCNKLTTVTLPSSLTEYGDYAFYKCKWLENISIPSNIKRLGNYAFANCQNLTEIIIPSNVEEIGERAFMHCTSLTKAYIQNSMNILSAYTFYYCTNLVDLKLPVTLRRIEHDAFNNCRSLKKIDFQYTSNLKYIGDYTFLNCSSLTTIKLPAYLPQINEGLFAYCSSLKSLTIPSKVREIYPYAFRDCSNLKTITFEDPLNWHYKTSNYTHWEYGMTMQLGPMELSGDLEIILRYMTDTRSDLRWYNYLENGDECDDAHLWAYCTNHTSYRDNVDGTRPSYVNGTFTAQAGKKYSIFFRDSDGCGNSYCDIRITKISTPTNDWIISNDIKEAYSSPFNFTLDKTEDVTIYVKIEKTNYIVGHSDIISDTYESDIQWGDTYDLIVVDYKDVVFHME